MPDFDLPEAKLAGEKHVELWLTENGYTNIVKEELRLNEKMLLAKGNIEHILVHVITCIHPNRPYKLSEFEADVVTRRAAKLQVTAYAAYVVIDTNNDLFEDIRWDRLK